MPMPAAAMNQNSKGPRVYDLTGLSQMFKKGALNLHQNILIQEENTNRTSACNWPESPDMFSLVQLEKQLM